LNLSAFVAYLAVHLSALNCSVYAFNYLLLISPLQACSLQPS
jgi:hypothetical protein